MSKIRVYELARELKVESKVLVPKIKDIGIDVSSHQSTLGADQAVRIKRQFQGGTSESAKTPRVIRRRRKAETAPAVEAAEVEGSVEPSQVAPETVDAAQQAVSTGEADAYADGAEQDVARPAEEALSVPPASADVEPTPPEEPSIPAPSVANNTVPTPEEPKAEARPSSGGGPR